MTLYPLSPCPLCCGEPFAGIADDLLQICAGKQERAFCLVADIGKALDDRFTFLMGLAFFFALDEAVDQIDAEQAALAVLPGQRIRPDQISLEDAAKLIAPRHAGKVYGVHTAAHAAKLRRHAGDIVAGEIEENTLFALLHP